MADDLVQRFRSALARVVVHPLHHFGDVITDAYVCRKADWVVIEQHADELTRLRAEVAENKREIDELVRAVNLGSERAKKAERERDELRRRIAEAPKADVSRHAHLGPLALADTECPELYGKRVALVRLDTEEAK